MKKAKITGIIVAALLTGVLIFSVSLDGIVKSQLEGNLTVLMKTDVVIDEVDISILGGESEIKGVHIKNPDEFSDRNAIVLGEIDMDLKVSTLFGDQIVIRDLRISDPEIYVEQKGTGVNLRALNENIDEASGGSDSGKGMIIEYLLVENGSITVSTEIEKERTVTATLDQLEIDGIGQEGSDSVEQAIRQIMTPIINEALTEALKDGVMQQLENKARDLLGG